MTATQAAPAPGIYENLSAEAYHAAPALSNGGLKTFLVSPLHYWHATLNPALECALCSAARSEHPTVPCQYFSARAETPALRLGSALHVAVLEPDKFLDRYAPRPTEVDFPDALVKVDGLKKWLVANAVPFSKSALKPELEDIAEKAGAPVLAALKRQQAIADAGRKYLDKAEWSQVRGMAAALRRESALAPYLAGGVGEVSIFATDPETGVLLKCRLDWMAACRAIVDLKSFSTRGESVDAAVSRVIQYEYRRQPPFYLYVMKLAGLADFDWIYAFVESDAPYETRLRSMGASGRRGVNKYWEATEREVRDGIKSFARYQSDFADGAPWAYHQAITPVRDSEMSRVIYAAGGEEL